MNSQDDAARFRVEAEDCRKLAEAAKNPADKEAWLRLAGDWIKIAEGVEEDQLRRTLRRGDGD
jgi:hypothetical protein